MDKEFEELIPMQLDTNINYDDQVEEDDDDDAETNKCLGISK